MADYIATFFTHYDAMQFKRRLEKTGAEGTMCPVPRWLSSSCGTCMRYEAEDTLLELMDKDLESIAEALGSEKYSVIYKSEE